MQIGHWLPNFMENLLNPGLASTLLSPYDLQEGVASLSRGVFFKEASLDMTLSILTESAARMSGVERVSIWALNNGQQELRCLELYERSSARHSSGGALLASQYPAYFQALHNEGCIAADDPAQHPMTLELNADYLQRHRVSAMLATPIHIRGELQGVLCLEQVGPRQPWAAVHRLFAQAVANLVTLALVEYEAEQARTQARTANERLQAVFDASRDAMLLVDGESGIVLDANRQAESLFACPRRLLIGKHQRALHPVAVADECALRFRQLVTGQSQSRVLTDIQRADGSVKAVEIATEVADVSGGRKLVLGIFRPI